MIEPSNNSQAMKTNSHVTNQMNSATNRQDVQHSQWEFFKRNYGPFTDYINKPMNIPSMAILPNFLMKSKAMFAPISMAVNYISALLNMAKKISAAISKDSTPHKQEEMVKFKIEKGFKER